MLLNFFTSPWIFCTLLIYLRLSLCHLVAPQEIAGHTSAIKKALWCNTDKQIISASEDKTIRSVWWLSVFTFGKYLLFVLNINPNLMVIASNTDQAVDLPCHSVCLCPGSGTGPLWRRWRHWPLTQQWAVWNMWLMERFLWSHMERQLLSTMLCGNLLPLQCLFVLQYAKSLHF